MNNIFLYYLDFLKPLLGEYFLGQNLQQPLNEINQSLTNVYESNPTALRYSQIRKPFLDVEFYVVATCNPQSIALDVCTYLIRRCLENTSYDIIDQLAGSRVLVLGESEVLTNNVEFICLKGQLTSNGRTIDSLRGLGASQGLKISATAEENLLRLANDSYYNENIFIHEFGHHIMNLCLTPALVNLITEDYLQALKNPSFIATEYNLTNALEYWAEGVQAWFNASNRTDVNNGINRRSIMQEKDILLSDLLTIIFGNEDWYYNSDMPQSKYNW